MFNHLRRAMRALAHHDFGRTLAAVAIALFAIALLFFTHANH